MTSTVLLLRFFNYANIQPVHIFFFFSKSLNLVMKLPEFDLYILKFEILLTCTNKFSTWLLFKLFHKLFQIPNIFSTKILKTLGQIIGCGNINHNLMTLQIWFWHNWLSCFSLLYVCIIICDIQFSVMGASLSGSPTCLISLFLGHSNSIPTMYDYTERCRNNQINIC